jgi:hypothetical protein
VKTNANFTVTAHVNFTKETTYHVQRWKVSLEGGGFKGEGECYTISSAFEKAYIELMAEAAQGVFI